MNFFTGLDRWRPDEVPTSSSIVIRYRFQRFDSALSGWGSSHLRIITQGCFAELIEDVLPDPCEVFEGSVR